MDSPNNDTQRLDWLASRGRISLFSDGWNAWIPNTAVAAKNEDIRAAIDEAMVLDGNIAVAKFIKRVFK